MRLPSAVLLFLLLCGSLPSTSSQSKCDVKCLTPKTCIIKSTGDTHSIMCNKTLGLGMRVDNDDYYTAGKKWFCNDREYGPLWVDTDPKSQSKDDKPPIIAAWRPIKTVECVEKLPCHLMNPLISSCRDSVVCHQLTPVSSEKVECGKDEFQLFVTNSVTKEMQTVPFVECNDKTGMWKIKNHSGYFPLPKRSNIRCVRPYENQETDRLNDTLKMPEELDAEYAKLLVKEYYQMGAVLCLFSCVLSGILACVMYWCHYVPRVRAYKHEWSGKQIHGGWRENNGRPRPKHWLLTIVIIRIINWSKYVLGCDRKPLPTLLNVYDDVSTCVSLTEESDFSDCDDCDNCKLCPDWMECGSLDDLADLCSTCSGGEACCSISTCSCTGPQPETTALSFSGTDNSEFEEDLDEELDKDKCMCKKLKRCEDRTCCILRRIPKRKPMKGHMKKTKVAAKADKKMKETKEWQDFYNSTNAKLMGINNETKLQKFKTKAEIEKERKQREREKELEANPEKEKEEEAKRIRNKERLRLKVHEDNFDSSLAVDKILQIMQRYRDGYDGFEDNDDLEEEENFRRAAAKTAEAEAAVKEAKRKADLLLEKEKKEEAPKKKKEYNEEEELKMKEFMKQEKERNEKARKEKEKKELEEMEKMTPEERKKEEERRAMREKMIKEREEDMKKLEEKGEDGKRKWSRVEPRPRNRSTKPDAQSRQSKAERKPVQKNYKDKKVKVARQNMVSAKPGESFGDIADIITGTAVNLKNPKRLSRAETKRM